MTFKTSDLNKAIQKMESSQDKDHFGMKAIAAAGYSAHQQQIPYRQGMIVVDLKSGVKFRFTCLFSVN